jgi:GNAT superfamily N-acetyltransferase
MDPSWLARPAALDDYEAFVRLVPELGIPDPIPDRARWDAHMRSDMIFLERAGAPAGYCWGIALGATGRVIHVVVDPAARGRGAGGALMAAMAERLRAAGCVRWALNVKIDNVPAIRLYERSGMRQVLRSAALWLPWEGVAMLPREDAPASSSEQAPAPAVTARAVDPGEEAALEAAFALLPGRLADFRARGRVLVRLVDPAHPSEPRVGLASFDPAFPGALPFAVARPALAAPLLAALRPYGRPEDARVHLLVEGDDALVAVLRGAGASVAFELLSMAGDIPPPA